MPQRWRATRHGIDPDAVSRSVQIAGGLCSWADPTRTLYQLGAATIEVYEQRGTGTLLINDADRETVLNTAARLGYASETMTVTAISPASTARRETMGHGEDYPLCCP